MGHWGFVTSFVLFCVPVFCDLFGWLFVLCFVFSCERCLLLCLGFRWMVDAVHNILGGAVIGKAWTIHIGYLLPYLPYKLCHEAYIGTLSLSQLLRHA